MLVAGYYRYEIRRGGAVVAVEDARVAQRTIASTRRRRTINNPHADAVPIRPAGLSASACATPAACSGLTPDIRPTETTFAATSARWRGATKS